MQVEPIETIFVDANGQRFEVATCGTGDRLALCLHGFPEHAFSWRYQLPLLAELGYRAWAPNQRGYGATSMPARVADYDLVHLLADVAALIDASGATSVTLIGHDWGAVVAWFFAMRRLRPLERLVIMNVPHPAVFAEQFSFAQLRRSWYIAFFQLPLVPERVLAANDAAWIARALRGMAIDRSNFSDDVLAVYRANALRPGGLTAMLNWYRALVRGGFARQRAAGYPPIDVPVLMIWGEEDTALGKETTYGTERYVPNLTLRYLPRVSHWVQQEAPEPVNAMLRAFLQGEPVPFAHSAV